MLQQSLGLPQPLFETLDLPRHSDAQRAVLLEKLDEFNIPVRTQWGTGSAKRLEDLVTELEKGECTLLTAGRTLFREFRVARIDLYYFNEEGRLLKLVEDRQEFNDGRVRNRGFKYAVGEKAKPFEPPIEAAHRGLAEELKIHGRFNLAPINSFVEIEAPKDFPGIPSISRRADYRLILPPNFYRADGYIDVQDDKKTFFIWVPAPFQALPEPRENRLISF